MHVTLHVSNKEFDTENQLLRDGRIVKINRKPWGNLGFRNKRYLLPNILGLEGLRKKDSISRIKKPKLLTGVTIMIGAYRWHWNLPVDTLLGLLVEGRKNLQRNALFWSVSKWTGWEVQSHINLLSLAVRSALSVGKSGLSLSVQHQLSLLTLCLVASEFPSWYAMCGLGLP